MLKILLMEPKLLEDSAQMEFRARVYPSKQGIPSALPRILASFIMYENSDPLFRLREAASFTFLSTKGTWSNVALI